MSLEETRTHSDPKSGSNEIPGLHRVSCTGQRMTRRRFDSGEVPKGSYHLVRVCPSFQTLRLFILTSSPQPLWIPTSTFGPSAPRHHPPRRTTIISLSCHLVSHTSTVDKDKTLTRCSTRECGRKRKKGSKILPDSGEESYDVWTPETMIEGGVGDNNLT